MKGWMKGWIDGWRDGLLDRSFGLLCLIGLALLSRSFMIICFINLFLLYLRLSPFISGLPNSTGQLGLFTWELYNPVLTASGQTHSRLNVPPAHRTYSEHHPFRAPHLPPPAQTHSEPLGAYSTRVGEDFDLSRGWGVGGSGPAEASSTRII